MARTRKERQATSQPLTRPASIDRLLQSLCTLRSPLQVSVGGTSLSCSAILAIDAHSGELIMDELRPATGHAHLMEAGRGVAAGSHAGVALRFDLVVNSVGRKDGAHFYRIARPRRIAYAQRRTLYRVRVGAAIADTSISIPADGERRVAGVIHDLSTEGIGASFAPGMPLEVGQLLPDVLLSIDEQGPIACVLQIAFARRDLLHGSRLRVGACFVELSRAQRARIGRRAAALERAAARRHPYR